METEAQRGQVNCSVLDSGSLATESVLTFLPRRLLAMCCFLSLR